MIRLTFYLPYLALRIHMKPINLSRVLSRLRPALCATAALTSIGVAQDSGKTEPDKSFLELVGISEEQINNPKADLPKLDDPVPNPGAMPTTLTPPAGAQATSPEVPSFGQTEAQARSEAASLMGDLSNRRISLLDAVRMALANNPNVQLSVEDVNIAIANLQQAQGSFDHRVNANASYRTQDTELKDTEKDKERARYQILRELYKSSNTILNRIDKVKSGKMDPFDFNTNGTAFTDNTIGVINSKTEKGPTSNAERGIEESLQLQSQKEDRLQEILLSKLSGGETAEMRKLTLDIIKLQEGIFQKVRAATLNGLINTPPWIVMNTETHNYDIALNRRFRGGPELQIFGNLKGTETNAGTRGGDPRENRTAIGASLSVNVLKMGHADPAFAEERARMQRVLAQREMARSSISEHVLDTTLAYWQVAAAQERLEFLVQSELESAVITGITKKLAEAKVLPESDLQQALGRQFQAAADRLAGEVQLATAQQVLAVAIGLDPLEMFTAPLASDPLPPVVSDSASRGLAFKELVDWTFENHGELRAFRYLNNATDVLVEQSRRDLAPDLNMFMGGEFTGYNQQTGLEGYFGAWGSKHTGASFNVGVRLDWPLENRVRESAYLANTTEARKTRLIEADGKRRLASRIALDMRNVLRTGRQVREIGQAVGSLEQSLDFERKKLDLKTATLLDVILTQQNLTQVRVAEVSANLAHAASIANLRFSTFTILPLLDFDSYSTPENRSSIPLTKDYFTRLPSVDFLRSSKNPVLPMSGPEEVWGTKPLPLLNRFTSGRNDVPEYTPVAPLPNEPKAVPAGTSAPVKPAALAVAKPLPQASAPPSPVAPAPAVVPKPQPAPAQPKPLLKKIFGGND